MSAGTPISVAVGVDYPVQVSLLDGNGSPVTIFSNSDTPFAEIWSGSSTPISLSPYCNWIDAASGTFYILITATATEGISPGKYRLRYGAAVTSTGQTFAAQDVFIEFTASPGSSTYTSYSAYQDLLDYFPALEQLQDSGDTEGFARQRDKARRWIDRTIQRNRVNASGYYSLGVNGPSIFGFWSGWWMVGQDDPTLQGYLDANLLIIKPIVIEMASKKALGYVLKAQVGMDDKSTAWQRLGAQFDWEAEAMACKYTAEIDINGDGYSDITIPCGKASHR